MRSDLLSSFHEFQRVLVLCPFCGEIHRLSELKLSYRGRVKRTWIDALRQKEEQMDCAEERFEEQRDEIREKAQEKGYKQVPKLLKKCTPVVCAHGYYPQDLKALFDPVDFVIFDGLKRKEKVKQVVFFDGPAHNKQRERIQKSIKRVLKKGNYRWSTVKLDENGRITVH